MKVHLSPQYLFLDLSVLCGVGSSLGFDLGFGFDLGR